MFKEANQNTHFFLLWLKHEKTLYRNYINHDVKKNKLVRGLTPSLTYLIFQSCSNDTFVPRSDKRATECQFGHSELLTPTESATKEVSLDITFNTNETK